MNRPSKQDPIPELRIAKSAVAEVLIIVLALAALFLVVCNVRGSAQGKDRNCEPAPFYLLVPPF